jgi:hypothetical protein
MIHTVITMKVADGPAGVRAPASTPSSFKIEAASVNRKKEKKNTMKFGDPGVEQQNEIPFKHSSSRSTTVGEGRPHRRRV